MITLVGLHFLASSPAFAGDEASPDTEGVVQIPEGTIITPPGKKPFTVSQFSYLLPEPYFDKALISAKKLAVCEPALADSQATTLRWIEVSDKALAACESQFTVDAATVTQLNDQVRTLEVRAVTAETRLKDVRQQRTVAWAITGGLVLGAVAVTAVAIGG
jgi:hypothetical protein